MAQYNRQIDSLVAARSELFDRAAAACAESQRVIGQSTRTVRHARATRTSSARLRQAVVQIRVAWADAASVHAILRGEVERIARAMRDAGADDRATVATMRAHIRFVLYDGGITEHEAEPVVERVITWIEQVYAA